MMRLTRRAPLLVAFCMLTSAAAAHAECAWVLWEQYSSSGDGDWPWKLYTAYPTVSACTNAIDQREAEARRVIPFLDIARRAPTDLFVTDRKAKWGRAWQCFPDTVYPRAPKGEVNPMTTFDGGGHHDTFILPQ